MEDSDPLSMEEAVKRIVAHLRFNDWSEEDRKDLRYSAPPY